MAHENDPASFLSELEENEWQAMREVGRKRYVYRDHILYMGVPAAILASLFHHFFFRQRTTAHLYSREFLFELLVALLIFSLVFMERGLRHWKRMQRRRGR